MKITGLRVLEPFDPYWFEDPLVMDDIMGMKQICDAIARSEREQTLWGFRELAANLRSQHPVV